MGKTFEEYWWVAEGALLDMAELNDEFAPKVNYEAVKYMAKVVWEDSRYNMTTRDI